MSCFRLKSSEAFCRPRSYAASISNDFAERLVMYAFFQSTNAFSCHEAVKSYPICVDLVSVR